MNKSRIAQTSIEVVDQRGFKKLVEKYQHRLSRMLARYLGDSAEIDDLCQEVFLKAYLALPSFRGDSAFYTWLYRIGVNTAKNHLIARGRKVRVSTDFDVSDAETFGYAEQLQDFNTPDQVLHSKQIGRTVNEAVESLPDELRQVIVFREIDGLSYDEIAQKMSSPIGTVRSRIFRAREAVAGKLRHLIEITPDRRW